MPELVQIAGGHVRIGGAVDDEDPAGGGDGRDRRAAAVEEHELGRELDREPRSLVHVRDGDRTGETAAAAPAADRLDPGQRSGLEVVGGGVAAAARELEQRLDVRRHRDDLRLRRTAPPHRDDDDAPVAGVEPGRMRGDRSLADPLAGADDPDRGKRERLERGRVEAKVGADVRETGREHAAREPEPLPRPEHRLVGEVDDELRAVLGEGGVEVGRDTDAVVGVPAQLLGAADDVRRDEVVRELLERSLDDRRVVLAVDECQGAHHERVVTSSSIRPVYFSYSNVSSENWMIRSCPWNGCLRQTATWLPETSTTL